MVHGRDAAPTKDGAACPIDVSQPPGLDVGLAELSNLDARELRQRWRSLVGGSMPAGLGRDLVLRILAYHQQALRYGDLDRRSRQVLAQIVAKSSSDGVDGSTPLLDDAAVRPCPKPHIASDHAKILSRVLRPGTLLTRDHEGVAHRVVVMEAGFCWNGKTYDNLSKIAFAITGTRWNGPRFFGLRDRTRLAAAADPRRRDKSSYSPPTSSSRNTSP